MSLRRYRVRVLVFVLGGFLATSLAAGVARAQVPANIESELVHGEAVPAADARERHHERQDACVSRNHGAAGSVLRPQSDGRGGYFHG